MLLELRNQGKKDSLQKLLDKLKEGYKDGLKVEITKAQAAKPKK